MSLKGKARILESRSGGSAGILPVLAGILPASLRRATLLSAVSGFPTLTPWLTGWKPVRAGRMPALPRNATCGHFGQARVGGKKRRSGQIIAINIPKRLFYPTFAVEAKLPFPMETGG
jgi:hypothetical protein